MYVTDYYIIKLDNYLHGGFVGRHRGAERFYDYFPVLEYAVTSADSSNKRFCILSGCYKKNIVEREQFFSAKEGTRREQCSDEDDSPGVAGYQAR